MKLIVATQEDRHWLLNRAVEVDRDDIRLLLLDGAWENSGDDAFDAINRIAKQAGIGCYP